MFITKNKKRRSGTISLRDNVAGINKIMFAKFDMDGDGGLFGVIKALEKKIKKLEKQLDCIATAFETVDWDKIPVNTNRVPEKDLLEEE